MISGIITMADGSQAHAVIFDDIQTYVHEPVCDSYGSIADALETMPGAKFQCTGIFFPIQEMRASLEDQYKAALEQMTSNYEKSNAHVTKYEEMVYTLQAETDNSTPEQEPS